jgi:hypothetical protein
MDMVIDHVGYPRIIPRMLQCDINGGVMQGMAPDFSEVSRWVISCEIIC